MIRLKQIREEHGIPQKSLAADMCVSQATISAWETGKQEMSYQQLIDISNRFNVSIDYLLGRSDSGQNVMIQGNDNRIVNNSHNRTSTSCAKIYDQLDEILLSRFHNLSENEKLELILKIKNPPLEGTDK